MSTSPSQRYFPIRKTLKIYTSPFIFLLKQKKLKSHLPDTYLFFIKLTRYPGAANSNSTPDRVVPSQLNCVKIVCWLPGPRDSSTRAFSEPTPAPSMCGESSVNFQMRRFVSGSHCALGLLCTVLKPPSIGTETCTFSNDIAVPIARLLYL